MIKEKKVNKVTLYGLNKAGGHKLWAIETKDEEIHIEFGQENGKIQLKAGLVCRWREPTLPYPAQVAS